MNQSLPRRITVSIGELSLRGFPSEQQHRIASQLEAGLARILTDPVVVARLSQAGHVSTLRLKLPAGQAARGSTSMGEQAAGAIIRGLQP